MNQKTKSIILLSLPVALAIVISLVLQFTILTKQEAVASWLSQFGPYLIVAYIIVQSITIIIAPIGGLFLQVALFGLFDPGFSIMLIYLTTTPLYFINFFLARKYGRPLVERIVGKIALDKIDNLAEDAGILTLVILKVFQGGLFDYLSYAYGLTKVPFKTFLLVNIFGGIPSAFISYLIIKKSSSLTSGIITLMIVAYLLGGISIYLNHQIRKRKKSG